MDLHLQWLGTSTFFFLPKNNKPEVLRNKPNLTDLQLTYFQSSKSVRTNMDVALLLWLTWIFTSKWLFKSKSVSSGHVLLFKNIQLPGSENIPSVHQQEKHLWNLLKSEKFSLISFAFSVNLHVQSIWQGKTPPQNHTNTALCFRGVWHQRLEILTRTGWTSYEFLWACGSSEFHSVFHIHGNIIQV